GIFRQAAVIVPIHGKFLDDMGDDTDALQYLIRSDRYRGDALVEARKHQTVRASHFAPQGKCPVRPIKPDGTGPSVQRTVAYDQIAVGNAFARHLQIGSPYAAVVPFVADDITVQIESQFRI